MTQEELLSLIDQAAAEGWTELDLSGQGLTELPMGIKRLTNLVTIHLYGNRITQIPEVIGQLTNLTTLDLSLNQITQIPKAVEQLTSLTTLNLSSNRITQIPEVIGQLTRLRVLNLHNNQITEISGVIKQLANLTTLNLWGNQITQIPKDIAQLTNLKELYLFNNRINQISDSIGQLTDLTELDLFNNQITEIPQTISKLIKLTKLDLSHNQITEIPQSIKSSTNLEIVSLAHNRLTQFPEVIGQLTNLVELYLSSNRVRQIPESVGQLAHLTKFDLHNNQITTIAKTVEQLTNLTILNLSDNQIQTIPDWLEALPKLRILDVRGNPLPISPEVLGSLDLNEAPGSVEGIFNYCRQLRSGKVRPLNEAKLLLVGQGSVGKTSLIKRLIDNQFDRHQAQTDGLNVRTWNVHVNSKDVRLNVWDFGGQEIYHATHQFFLTKRSLYLLVCNCRTSEDENRIEYWLKLIESFGGESPVIIVGNKCDEQPLDINRRALREKYHNIQAILETSCETSQGIDDLRTAIIREVGLLSDVYNLLPLSWFEVKEHLEHMEQDCISYDKYAEICESKTITEDYNQEQLISLLHSLGLVLNFRDHPFLQDTNVLNPDWVTQGIYAILSDFRE